jgi:MFS family permease
LSRFAALSATFKNRNYAIYTTGNCLSLLGFWMQRLAVSWLTWELSHDEFWVGAVGFAEIVPLIFIGPLFGVWADRLPRKSLAMLLQSLMLLQTLGLFIALQMQWLTIGWLFALTLLEGSLQAAYQPVRLALIPNLVKKTDLVAAAAFTAVTFNVARFLGPAIAGVVIALSSPAWAILFNGFSYLGILVAWWFIKLAPEQQATRAQPNSMFSDLREGWHYIAREPALALLFSMLMLLAVFARPLTYMLSAFVGAIYHAGPQTLALFTSAVGAGAVLAGLKLSMQARAQGLVQQLLWNSLLNLVSVFAFALTTNEVFATCMLFTFGYSVTICAVASQTLVQHSVHDRMRGRVLSLWVAATRGPPAIGVLVLGWLATHFGLPVPFVTGVILCLVGMLYLAQKRRTMRSFFEAD